mmetsp:Transcript_53012/g.105183  ORF Transcript_53012/g.105183 Transcript_53012/m.105183 type:complete len:360 (+) Transcript_53012:187-1266(+)
MLSRVLAAWLIGYYFPCAAVHQSSTQAATMGGDALHRAPSFDLIESSAFIQRLPTGDLSGPAAVGVTDNVSVRKTGTTIVGVFCKAAGAVVLGADTRATNGEIVADKRCEKIHRIAPNIYCCGAGTAADAEHLTQAVARELSALRLSMSLVARETTAVSSSPMSHRDSGGVVAGEILVDAQSRVAAAHCLLKKSLYESQGACECALVLGGVDCVGGASLVAVHGGGSSQRVDTFVAMGSGELAATAALEAGWRPDLGLDEAVALVTTAVRSGVMNDLGSGSCVDLCVISPSQQPPACGVAAVRYIRGHKGEERQVLAKKFPGVSTASSPPARAQATRYLTKFPSLVFHLGASIDEIDSM